MTSSVNHRRAWQIERELRLSAIPLDRRVHPSEWYTSQTAFPTGDELLLLFWDARVPGSGAPEIPYVEMVQSWANQGYDVTEAELLLPVGIQLSRERRIGDLRALTVELLDCLHRADPIPNHPYWGYDCPFESWEAVRSALGQANPRPDDCAWQALEERTLQGWLGQLAGGAFGTPIEGYHSSRLGELYGVIDEYVTQPETINDDVVYQLVFLDVFERHGRKLTSKQLALEWVRQIPFGWSAEWVALRNLSLGLMPPATATFRNPYTDLIGCQMRGMICGMLAPGWPMEAARLAYLDGVISHVRNGLYGGMYAAALTALAYVCSDARALAEEALAYVPPSSEYAAVAREIITVLRREPDPIRAWQQLDQRFETYNWMHAYPNLAADLLALWHANGDLSNAFRWIAHAGLDADCNAGLVGTVLGIMHGVPHKWAEPLGDRLETYLPGKERLSIRALAARTAALARQNLPSD
ncbi:MAG: ADP-ribosylglycohydrolase family protein [Anaerolineae bacterium]|nr:ADP-ribosylglycohydrolase family protein [Anaerolineae bacterium]